MTKDDANTSWNYLVAAA